MKKHEKFAIQEALICILKLMEPMELNNWENESKIRRKYIESTIKLLELTKEDK